MPETLYLFRHCAVDARLREIGRGSLDYPLSPEGEQMSLEIARFLHAKQIQQIITTGRRRTDVIGMELAMNGVEHVTDKRFQELHIPPVKSWEEIQREFPDDAKQYGRDFDALEFSHGETPEQVRDRVIQGWMEVERREIARLAIVAHDTSNQWLLAHFKERAEQMPQALGGMYQIEFQDSVPRFILENVMVTDIKT